MTRTTEGTFEDTMAHLAALRQDIARLSDSVSALLQNPAPGVAKQVSDAVDDAKAKFSSKAADVKSRVNVAGGEIEAIIERQLSELIERRRWSASRLRRTPLRVWEEYVPT